MEAVCGCNCNECELMKNKKCEGCKNTNACPFGKKCWIASYIEIGGKESLEKLKKNIIDEFNLLNIDGMPKIEELYILKGDFINLEYTLENGNKVKFLNDNDVYFGNQVECLFNDDIKRCFGLVANTNFLLVCEYDEDGLNPEIIIYKKR